MWALVESRVNDGHIFTVKPYANRDACLSVAEIWFEDAAEADRPKLYNQLVEFGEVCLDGTRLSVIQTT